MPIRRLARLLVALVVVPCAAVRGQEAPEGPEEPPIPLYERQPFDRIIVKGGGPNRIVEVQPLDLPNRRVPNPFPSGALKFRLSDTTKGTNEYSYNWTQIERVELFEQILLAEAAKLTSTGKFDEAYDYYAKLMRRFPDVPGLEAALNEYLVSNAMAAYGAQEFDRALAILGSLYDRNPNSRGLGSAVDTVAGKIIEQYLQDKDYKSARMTLDIVGENFRNLPLSVTGTWTARFQQRAATQIEAAKTALAAGDFDAARAAIDQAVGIWPEIPGSEELRRTIQAADPQVSVGVFEAAPVEPSHRLDSWPHGRTAGLSQPLLSELAGYSPEGGFYRTPVGEITIDPSGLLVTITVIPSEGIDDANLSVAVAALARDLLLAANGEHPAASPTLARVVEDVVVEYPSRVRLRLANPHVRPEALLRMPMPAEVRNVTSSVNYTLGRVEDGESIFVISGDEPPAGGMAEVREVLFDSEEAAIAALVRGDIDIIDRIPPWQVDRLRGVDDVTVSMYKLPTVHALVPTNRQPLLEKREFRRAICYGLDRASIVNRILLNGKSQPGFKAVSGPFADRDNVSDLGDYAYNGSVKPRGYEIRLASMLLTVAWNGVQPKVPKDQTPPPLPPLPGLVLAHGTDPTARAACQAIRKQLAPLGLELELVEMTADELTDPELEGVDLRYVELLAWEPVADVRTLLGPGGTVGAGSDFLVFALDDLDAAGNWSDVSRQMYAMHQIVASELPVIPLWQARNHFARRNYLAMPDDSTVTLYQDIDKWQVRFD